MQKIQELLTQQAAIDRQIVAIRIAERARVIFQVKELMAQHGLTSVDVIGVDSAAHEGTKKQQVKKVAAKYRDPLTGATWTGRGLKPKWMAEAVAAGRLPAEFAI